MATTEAGQVGSLPGPHRITEFLRRNSRLILATCFPIIVFSSILAVILGSISCAWYVQAVDWEKTVCNITRASQSDGAHCNTDRYGNPSCWSYHGAEWEVSFFYKEAGFDVTGTITWELGSSGEVQAELYKKPEDAARDCYYNKYDVSVDWEIPHSGRLAIGISGFLFLVIVIAASGLAIVTYKTSH